MFYVSSLFINIDSVRSIALAGFYGYTMTRIHTIRYYESVGEREKDLCMPKKLSGTTSPSLYRSHLKFGAKPDSVWVCFIDSSFLSIVCHK